MKNNFGVTIDFHIHLGKNWGVECYAVSEERLSNRLRENQIEKAVIFAQPRPDYRIANSNNPFLPEKANDRVGLYAEKESRAIPFCYLDHRHPDSADELSRCVKKYDVKGVKIHPGLNIQYREKTPIFELSKNLLDTAEEYNLPIIMHPALYDGVGIFETAISRPETNFIIAHFALFDTLSLLFVSSQDNLYIDSSAITTDTMKSITGNPFESASQAIRKLPKEKIIFGSDFPWAQIESEIDFLRDAGAGEEIFHQNALKLLP